MKIINFLILNLFIQAAAFAENGLLFSCIDERQREFSFEYLYEDQKINSVTRATRTGTEITISWFHPYCSVGYTYNVTGTLDGPKFEFLSGGQSCEGVPYQHECKVEPIK